MAITIHFKKTSKEFSLKVKMLQKRAFCKKFAKMVIFFAAAAPLSLLIGTKTWSIFVPVVSISPLSILG